MRAHLTMARNTLMSAFTYRAHILFQFLASFLTLVVLWFVWKAVYTAAGTPEIRGMTFDQTFTYVALATALFVMMRSWVDWDIHWQVRSGDIVVHFFRPYGFMGITFANSLGSLAGNFLTVTVPSLAALFLVFQVPLPPWPTGLLVVPALVQAYVLSFLVDFAVGVTAFRTESIWGISFTKEMVVLFLSGGMVPLAWFPDTLREVLMALPFASMYNTPLTLLSGGSTDLGTVAERLGLQTFWIIISLTVVRFYYNVTVKKLTVAGG